jgi:hypothetical protein
MLPNPKHPSSTTENDVAIVSHDASVGLSTDAAVTTNTTGTLNAKLRGLVAIFADVWDSTNHWFKTQIQAGENHIGMVGGTTKNVVQTIARPADTNAYAAGDLIANSTTAGSVTFQTLDCARVAGAGFAINGVRIYKTTSTLTNAIFRVHLYDASPRTVSNGDNGVFLSDGADTHIGYVDVTTDVAFSTPGAQGFAPCSMLVRIPSGTTLYLLLEARAAYAPGSAEQFEVTLEISQD